MYIYVFDNVIGDVAWWLKSSGRSFNELKKVAGPQPKKTAPVTRLPVFPTEFRNQKNWPHVKVSRTERQQTNLVCFSVFPYRNVPTFTPIKHRDNLPKTSSKYLPKTIPTYW